MKPAMLKLFVWVLLVASHFGIHSLVAGAWISVTLTITAFDNSAAERGEDTAAFRITRSGPTGFPITVQFDVGGTATRGSDFALTTFTGANLTNEVTIPVGSDSVTIFVRPVDDSRAEETERVSLKLRSSTAVIINAPDSAEASIIDDDTVVTLTSDVTEIEERHARRATLTFTRAGSTTESLAIGYSVGGTATKGRLIGEVGADYTMDPDPNPPLLTIDAGQASKAISVMIIGDAPREGDETVVVSLSPPGPSYKLGSPSSATITIKEPPLPTVSIAGPTTNASETGPASAVFTVTRVGDLSVALVVFFDINPAGNSGPSFSSPPATLGSDYTLQAGTITIPAGSTSGTITIPSESPSATVTVIPIDDSIPESSEIVVIELKPKPSYLFGSSGTRASVGIEDNDRSTVSISATDPNATEDGDFGAFTVTRTNPIASDLAVRFRTPPSLALGGPPFATLDSDFVLQSASGNLLAGSVTIPAGSASAVIRVKPVDDNQIEPDERVMIELIELPDPSPYLVTLSAGPAVLLKDNDTNVVAVVAADANASESGPDLGSFKIFRTGSLAAALTAVYTLSGVATNGQDYNPLSGSVIIPAGQPSVVIDVIPIKDQQIEDAESVILTLNPSSVYVLGSQQSATVIIAGN